MKKTGISFLLIFVLFFGFARAQDVKTSGRKHLDALAADEMYGRGYLRDGYEKAVQYVEKSFTAYGLQTLGENYRQEFVYPVNTFPDSVTVVVGTKKLVPGQDYIVAPESGSAKGTFEPVYYTLNKLFLKNMPLFTPEQVVVIKPFSRKMSKDSLAFVSKRIAGFNEQTHVLVLTDEKLTWSVADEALTHAKVEISAKTFDTTARTIRLNIHNELNPSFLSGNVIGLVKAKKKSKKYIFVTAHLDHLGMMGSDAIFNGANDNASGVSLMLTLAEYYAKHKLKKTNLVFVAFGGEEAGLIGSKFYVDNPFVDLKQVRFLLNVDLMGTGSEGITVVNATKFTKEFEQLKSINTKGNYFTTIKPRGEAANSDHYWFTQAGVPSFFIYTMGGPSNYHDVFDRPEQLPLTKFNELHAMIVELLNALK